MGSDRSTIFEVVESSGLAAETEGRVGALVESACNFHALDNPGREVRIEVHVGPAGAMPILTDVRTMTGEQVEDYPLAGTVTIRSLVSGAPRRRFDPRRPDETFAEDGTRRILVTTDDETASVRSRLSARAVYWESRRLAEEHFPVAFDTLRQRVLDRRAEGLTKRTPRARPVAGGPRLEDAHKGPAAVLIGVHWFELGGAERWAFETVRLAREAGLVPIVVSDKQAPQEYIDARELDGAIKIVLTHPMDQEDRDQPLLSAVLNTFDVRGVFVHHCQWLYDRTPWLKRVRPDLPIADSTHILEYSGGGYAGIAAHVSEFIDIHHVISPQLESWFEDVQGVPAKRIVLAPLIGLSDVEGGASTFRRRQPATDFRVGFIGRFARQKRPYLFLTLMRDLLRFDRVRVRGVVQGDGELTGLVDRLIRKYRLERVVSLRPARRPVAETLAEIDCLVITSQNEGITLTTLEAIAAGVPVLSADVGSQSTLIPDEMLAPRGVAPFRRRARAIIRRLAVDEDLRERVWRRQVARVEEFSGHRTASEWARDLFADWRQDEPAQTVASPVIAEEGTVSRMTRIAAVVVAYNRVEKLKTVIASIEAQTVRPEWLVVVDNASTDGTAEYLRSLKTDLNLVIKSNPTNEGGAGGFADGMETGYGLGADFVWIMDDDCYPEPTALEELVGGFDRAVDKLGGDVPFACSLVRYVDGEICEMNNAEPTWDWPRLLSGGDQSVMVTTCSFVSVLFPRWVLERYGLPYREYFIWFDDAEYTKRLTRLCPGVQVLSSGVVHDMGDNKGVNFGLINNSNAWKFSYGIRNQASYRLHHESAFAFLIFAARVVLGMRRGRVGRRLQLRMLRRLLAGISFNPKIVYPSRTLVEQPSGSVE